MTTSIPSRRRIAGVARSSGASGSGHGSRLMAAAVDHARDDGVSRLVIWVFAADDPMRLFLRENGWEPTGRHATSMSAN